MKGKISKVWENRLDDGRSYLTLSINGERYNVWDKKYFGGLREGETVSYEFTRKGKYNNISSISKAEADQESRQNGNGFNGNGLDPASRKDLEIVRMSCLKTALSATQDLTDLTLNEKADTIIDVARRFESYVTDFDEFDPEIGDDDDDPKKPPK